MNILISIIILGLGSGVWWMNEFNYVDIDVDNDTHIKKITLGRDVPFTKKKHIIKKPVLKIKKEEVIKKTKQVIVKKKKPVVVLKTVKNLKYVSYGKDSTGKIIAVLKGKGKNIFISVGDPILDSVAEKVTAEVIKIKGYHPMFLTKSEYMSGKPKIVTVKQVVQRLKQRVVSVKTDLLENRKMIANSNTPTNLKPIHEPEKVAKKPKVLRSVVSEIIKSPKEIYNYIRLTQTKDGIAISPVNKYNYLFKKMGFKKGDIIVQVNQKNIKSKKLLVDLFNLSTAKSVNILLLNKGRYRKLNINLLKIYNFL